MELYDSVTQKLLEESAIAAYHLATSIVSTASAKLWQHEQTAQAARHYVQRYNERHGNVKILGMPMPIPLHSIYTDVATISPDYLQQLRTVAEMHEELKRNAGRGFGRTNDANRKSALSAANKIQFLNILGQPGSGKTTFLRRIGQEALLPKKNWLNTLKIATSFSPKTAWSAYGHDCFPVMIELSRFREEPVDLLPMIVNEFSIVGFPNPSQFVAHALEEGNLLLLLDGLDEVPKDKVKSVIKHVTDFVDQYGRVKPEPSTYSGETPKDPKRTNRFVTSCRNMFYKGFFKRFTDVEVADFDNKQISQFVGGWFAAKFPASSHLTRSRFFLELLYGEDHAATLELARSPLLLAFLCITFGKGQTLPPLRSLIYRKALLILLEEWAAEKQVHEEPAFKDFSADLELLMLAEIAGKSFSTEQFFYRSDDLKKSITAFLENELHGPEIIDAKKILEAVEGQQGLMVQRANDLYSFSHLTIQEYLTATYYVAKGEIRPLVLKYAFEPRWHEVFLLVAGILPNADLFLVAIMDKSDLHVRTIPMLCALLTWMNTIKPAKGYSSIVVYRIVLLLYVLEQNMDLELAGPKDKLLDRLRSSAKKLLFEIKAPTDILQFTPSSIGRALEKLKYELDVHRWSIKELEGLADYIEHWRFLVKCNRAALSVSRNTWNSIFDRLFTI